MLSNLEIEPREDVEGVDVGARRDRPATRRRVRGLAVRPHERVVRQFAQVYRVAAARLGGVEGGGRLVQRRARPRATGAVPVDRIEPARRGEEREPDAERRDERAHARPPERRSHFTALSRHRRLRRAITTGCFVRHRRLAVPLGSSHRVSRAPTTTERTEHARATL